MQGASSLSSSTPSRSRSRPISPVKQAPAMPRILEATPGPNAFALEQKTMENQRLRGNAFYQEEVRRRRATPPTTVHPALRPRSNSGPPSPGKLSVDQRDSSVTTLSPFINSSKERSPELKLVPDNAEEAEPTGRGFIEERREQRDWKANGGDSERTPVFVYTPKTTNTGFSSKPASRPQRDNEQIPDPPKSPKKTVLERLHISNFRSNKSPSSSTLARPNSRPETPEAGSNVPPKAAAILGTTASLSKPNLTRTPSKKKNPFSSRKNVEVVEPRSSAASSTSDASLSWRSRQSGNPHSGDEPPVTAFAVKTPQTAVSDPTHYSFHGRRQDSLPISDSGVAKEQVTGATSLGRSQSLHYYDKAAPPTPPDKNTPPDEEKKGVSPGKSPHHRRALTDDTPSKHQVGLLHTDGRISPTKSGSYARKEIPTLVEQPSMYSLHGVVHLGDRVASMDEASLEEMAREMNPQFYDAPKEGVGLGLSANGSVPEPLYGKQSSTVYSPSMYSSHTWSPQTTSQQSDHYDKDGGTPLMQRGPDREQASLHLAKPSSSSGSTIMVHYPDFVKDHVSPPASAAIRHDGKESRDGAKLPQHGTTYSHDHESSEQVADHTKLFAHGVEAPDLSPASFQRISAMPSPLRLQPTIYTPPPGDLAKRIRKALQESPSSGNARSPSSRTSGGKENHSVSDIAPHGQTPWDNTPQLSPRALFKSHASLKSKHSSIMRDEACETPGSTTTDIRNDKLCAKMDAMLLKLNAVIEGQGEIKTVMYQTCDLINAAEERRTKRKQSFERSVLGPFKPESSLASAGQYHAPFPVHDPYARVLHDIYATGSNRLDRSPPQNPMWQAMENHRRMEDMMAEFSREIQAMKNGKKSEGTEDKRTAH